MRYWFVAAAALVGAQIGVQAQTAPPAEDFPQVVETMRHSFPAEHSALAKQLAGKAEPARQRLIGEAVEKLVGAHLQAILNAPAARLIALEASHARMLRTLEQRDVKLCASLGDKGFLGTDARAAAPPPGLAQYQAMLVAAASEGAGRAEPSAAAAADYQAWLAKVKVHAPNVPVLEMLSDRELRLRSSPEHLCSGAAAMHAAVADLDPATAGRMARMLVKAVLAQNAQ